jgi:hypothetical protein
MKEAETTIFQRGFLNEGLKYRNIFAAVILLICAEAVVLSLKMGDGLMGVVFLASFRRFNFWAHAATEVWRARKACQAVFMSVGMSEIEWEKPHQDLCIFFT